MVFGDLQLVPIGDGLMYVRPWFLQPENSDPAFAKFDSVSITYGNDSVKGKTLELALQELYGELQLDLGDRPEGAAAGDGETDTDTDTGSGSGEPQTSPDDASPEELIARAQVLYLEAQDALADFDSKTYQEKMDEAYALLAQAASAATGLDITAVPNDEAPASTDAPTTTVDDTATGSDTGN